MLNKKKPALLLIMPNLCSWHAHCNPYYTNLGYIFSETPSLWLVGPWYEWCMHADTAGVPLDGLGCILEELGYILMGMECILMPWPHATSPSHSKLPFLLHMYHLPRPYAGTQLPGKCHYRHVCKFLVGTEFDPIFTAGVRLWSYTLNVMRSPWSFCIWHAKYLCTALSQTQLKKNNNHIDWDRTRLRWTCRWIPQPPTANSETFPLYISVHYEYIWSWSSPYTELIWMHNDFCKVAHL